LPRNRLRSTDAVADESEQIDENAASQQVGDLVVAGAVAADQPFEGVISQEASWADVRQARVPAPGERAPGRRTAPIARRSLS